MLINFINKKTVSPAFTSDASQTLCVEPDSAKRNIVAKRLSFAGNPDNLGFNVVVFIFILVLVTIDLGLNHGIWGTKARQQVTSVK